MYQKIDVQVYWVDVLCFCREMVQELIACFSIIVVFVIIMYCVIILVLEAICLRLTGAD